MPRMSEAEKQKSYGRILDSAARSVRVNGLEETSVADVMTAAGMTHGGFYRHFASKEELLAAAINHAAEAVLGPFESEREERGKEAIAGYVSEYLSEAHRHNRENGCPLAAVAGEALRDDGPSRDATQRAAHRTARFLSEVSDTSDTKDVADDLGLATLSVLVGSIVLARLFEDDREAEHVLQLGQGTVELLQDHFETLVV